MNPSYRCRIKGTICFGLYHCHTDGQPPMCWPPVRLGSRADPPSCAAIWFAATANGCRVQTHPSYPRMVTRTQTASMARSQPSESNPDGAPQAAQVRAPKRLQTTLLSGFLGAGVATTKCCVA